MLLFARSKLVLVLIFAAGLAAMSLTGCGAQPEEKRYPIQAEVIAADLPRKLLIVKHGDIPGYMPAMTMSYAIAVPKEAASLAPGDKITAELVVSAGKARLEKIVLLEKAKPNTAPTPAAAP
ncbi:MAG TPA: copper-binding protein [Candidatus Acidoferrum sp.]|nr:copper-binding protein [Candidatus Acidoferrum sp.]